MKKYLLLFLFLSAGGMVYLTYKFRPDQDLVSMNDKIFSDENFVSVGKNKFRADGKDFYPVILNYNTILKTDGKNLWVSPSLDYNTDTAHETMSPESSLRELSRRILRL